MHISCAYRFSCWNYREPVYSIQSPAASSEYDLGMIFLDWIDGLELALPGCGISSPEERDEIAESSSPESEIAAKIRSIQLP
jgi:hypothetical protein